MGHELEFMIGQSVPFLVLFESKALSDVPTSNQTTTRGRLTIDIFAARQAYARRQIDSNGWISGEDNLADDFTQKKEMGDSLKQ